VEGSGDYVGGLVGIFSKQNITNSYSTASVTGRQSVGGLVGRASIAGITNSYASGSVTGTADYVGGLVGVLSSDTSSIANSYATGEVIGTRYVGGLVGINDQETSIANAYATGKVTGTQVIGGLVGFNVGDIKTSYATGKVSGGTDVGGLVGDNTYVDPDPTKSITGTIDSLSFWDTQTSGQATSVGGVGKTTAQMKESATYTGWDILEDTTLAKNYPTLRMQDSGNVWVIGTKVASTGVGSAQTSNPSSNPTQNEVEKVVTAIVNQNVLTINPPRVETPNNAGQNVAVNFNAGGNQTLISQPIEGQNTQRISLSQAKQMQQENGVNSQEVRVPLSRSSMIELVDGGVNLPEGVEQEFYVAQEL
jgi:hypothetical protein